MFFLVNHGDESTGRCKMRLKKWFLELWILFWGFLDILGEVGNKIPELGSNLTEFGRACICTAQNLRKWIYLTWNMNKSPYERFHCEVPLSFLGPGLRVPHISSWNWNRSRAKISWILEIFNVGLESIWGDESNPEIISKMEKFGFSANFPHNWVFAKIKKKLNWNYASKMW